MKFSAPLYAVHSIERAKAFYRDVLGQTLIADFGTNITFEGFSLQEGFAELAGFSHPIQYRAHNGELYFETEDLEADAGRVRAAGVELLHEIKEYPWGQRVIRFYDLDGHIVELGESMISVICRFLAGGMSVADTVQRTMHPLELVQQCADRLKG